MTKYIIETKNLTFDYFNFRALDNINLKIKHGTITALVGPNGAGKTTLLRCLTAMQKPLSGEILIEGSNIKGNERSLYEKIGYLSDFFGLYGDLTVMQCLKYAGWSRNVYEELDSRISYVVDRFDLAPLLNNLTQNLSRGQKQKVAISQAIIHKPKILFLDEPASGLDPEARYKLSNLLLDLKKQGITIIVSSHILAELEDYCDQMIIIKNGKMIKGIDIKNKNNDSETSNISINLIEFDQKYLKIIQDYKLVTNCNSNEEKDQIDIEFQGNLKQQNEMLEYLISKKVPITNFYAKPQSFESIYIKNAK
jgi:ABC-2 type transport system ATP-binding protein